MRFEYILAGERRIGLRYQGGGRLAVDVLYVYDKDCEARVGIAQGSRASSGRADCTSRPNFIPNTSCFSRTSILIDSLHHAFLLKLIIVSDTEYNITRAVKFFGIQ